ncbi:hypothetical protein E3A20_08880 [Planctomyces bekefii]|uniref:Uncharacterized protein n=1 Tax=Planctomyces bekefii TaxID=1653850 RepID=A0A5C6M740_9PLAN|nr:hypothetical protein E3A20_08880 [Planctomyces bekefii]
MHAPIFNRRGGRLRGEIFHFAALSTQEAGDNCHKSRFASAVVALEVNHFAWSNIHGNVSKKPTMTKRETQVGNPQQLELGNVDHQGCHVSLFYHLLIIYANVDTING